MRLLTRVHALSLRRMFDNEDREALGRMAGAAVVGVGALALVAVSSAGILGLAAGVFVRAFQLAMG